MPGLVISAELKEEEMLRNKIFGSSKPKNVHSLENLKYLYNVLLRHQTVTESNRALLVETLRSISEILIWGDQNDSTVFDFFLEKNMLVFFIKYLEQKSGQYISVQLLQTLNILFENISKETCIYFLLSNNHVNSIISHQFDFTDEEVMAYYISFMKTLSLKLNKYTIHFFFNEHSEDFPLYTQAIKFFNHSESMVRIAVRTITLNIYKVENQRMQTFIREKTCAPYFSNLVWYMGNHVLELNSCVQHDINHKSKDKLQDLVAEHLDHLHYLNDILGLGIDLLNNILTDYLLNRLYIPLYVNSLIPDQDSQVGLSESQTNTTDDEKLGKDSVTASSLSLLQRPYIKAIVECLDAVDDDFRALLALCLLYAIGQNTGLNQEQLDTINFTTRMSKRKDTYNELLVDKIIKIITLSSQFAGKVRLATLELSIMVLNMLVVMDDGTSCLRDNHYATLISIKEESMALLRDVFKTEEIFLDMFEDEFREMTKRELNVEYLTMEATILLQPTSTPLTDIKFIQRLPCGEVERIRKAIRVYLHIRKLLQNLNGDIETQLPLSKSSDCVKVGDVLDLNNSDLIGCTVIRDKSSKKERRFLVIDITQLIMVEPETGRLGWGVVRFAGYLQDVEVTGDRDDSRSLHINIHKPASSHLAKPLPLLTAKLTFDDHIRCVAAKQRLTKGRTKARQRKMMVIANMLDLTTTQANAILQPSSTGYSLFSNSVRPVPGRITQVTSRPRSQAVSKVTEEVSALKQVRKSDTDLSKTDAYQALNSSQHVDGDSSLRQSTQGSSGASGASGGEGILSHLCLIFAL
ncbi:CLEC16A [Bugula neritina]|uniref:CLEC16A n=1 Tax=Bugula neritina TaxID=10212 RepID=A0A7J7JGM2_BUGNE|nr:CLEC16A [Bugula neritina]